MVISNDFSNDWFRNIICSLVLSLGIFTSLKYQRQTFGGCSRELIHDFMNGNRNLRPTYRCRGWGSKNQLEALRECRPPWPRQIITLILPTVKMLSLGCERLPTPLKKKKEKKKVLDHNLHHDLGMLPLLRCFFCSFTHLTIPRSPPKFNQFFLVLLRTRP